MTCAHVLGLIDAGPFAEYSRAHLEAVREHARGCPTCGPALAAATALAVDLAALPQVPAPSGLAAGVMARIARTEAADALPVRATSTPDWASWATTLGGLAAGVAAVLMILADDRIAWALQVVTGRADMPLPALPAAILSSVLFAGLVLYVTGLFAPVGAKRYR